MNETGGADGPDIYPLGVPKDLESPPCLPEPVVSLSLPLPALALPKFCRACGSQWEPDWLECPGCISTRRSPGAALAISAGQQNKSVRFALALYFTLLAASALGMVSVAAGAPVVPVILATTALHSLIVIVFVLGPQRKEVIAALTQRVNPAWFALAVAMAAGTFFIAMVFISLLHGVFHLQRIATGGDFFNAGYGWLAVILAVCVQPAVIEELAFRGVVLTALRGALSTREAVIVSALLFMTLHLTVASFPHLFLIGLALGYLRTRTESLLPGMLMHFTHNLLCVLAEHLMGNRLW